MEGRHRLSTGAFVQRHVAGNGGRCVADKIKNVAVEAIPEDTPLIKVQEADNVIGRIRVNHFTTVKGEITGQCADRLETAIRPRQDTAVIGTTVACCIRHVVVGAEAEALSRGVCAKVRAAEILCTGESTGEELGVRDGVGCDDTAEIVGNTKTADVDVVVEVAGVPNIAGLFLGVVNVMATAREGGPESEQIIHLAWGGVALGAAAAAGKPLSKNSSDSIWCECFNCSGHADEKEC